MLNATHVAQPSTPLYVHQASPARQTSRRVSSPRSLGEERKTPHLKSFSRCPTGTFEGEAQLQKGAPQTRPGMATSPSYPLRGIPPSPHRLVPGPEAPKPFLLTPPFFLLPGSPLWHPRPGIPASAQGLQTRATSRLRLSSLPPRGGSPSGRQASCASWLAIPVRSRSSSRSSGGGGRAQLLISWKPRAESSPGGLVRRCTEARSGDAAGKEGALAGRSGWR